MPILVGIGLVIVLGGTWAFFGRQATNLTTQPVACSREAKICPDGSTVGRAGPDCAFTLCPDEIQITNFAECAAAGYQITESSPRQCSANHQTFVEQTTNR